MAVETGVPALIRLLLQPFVGSEPGSLEMQERLLRTSCPYCWKQLPPLAAWGVSCAQACSLVRMPSSLFLSDLEGTNDRIVFSKFCQI